MHSPAATNNILKSKKKKMQKKTNAICDYVIIDWDQCEFPTIIPFDLASWTQQIQAHARQQLLSYNYNCICSLRFWREKKPKMCGLCALMTEQIECNQLKRIGIFKCVPVDLNNNQMRSKIKSNLAVCSFFLALFHKIVFCFLKKRGKRCNIQCHLNRLMMCFIVVFAVSFCFFVRIVIVFFLFSPKKRFQ